MFPIILPIRTYLFQALFLFSSIAIEAVVIHYRLKLSRRISVEYSASLNLLTTVIGWLTFFEVQALLPPAIKAQLISFIFYNQTFSSTWASSVNSLLILAGLTAFLCTIFVELTSLNLLEILLGKKKFREPIDPKVNRYRDKQFRAAAAAETRNRTITIFLGNALSYSLILLVLLIRSIE